MPSCQGPQRPLQSWFTGVWLLAVAGSSLRIARAVLVLHHEACENCTARSLPLVFQKQANKQNPWEVRKAFPNTLAWKAVEVKLASLETTGSQR